MMSAPLMVSNAASYYDVRIAISIAFLALGAARYVHYRRGRR
jgi:hypothetical protein